MGYTVNDRYNDLKKGDGTIIPLPFVRLPKNTSDKFETWNTERSRLDRISNKYYGNPLYDYLILFANPDYVSEFDIPDNVVIRIPFPLSKAKADYQTVLNRIINL